jgi:hypothetical protein
VGCGRTQHDRGVSEMSSTTRHTLAWVLVLYCLVGLLVAPRLPQLEVLAVHPTSQCFVRHFYPILSYRGGAVRLRES